MRGNATVVATHTHARVQSTNPHERSHICAKGIPSPSTSRRPMSRRPRTCALGLVVLSHPCRKSRPPPIRFASRRREARGGHTSSRLERAGGPSCPRQRERIRHSPARRQLGQRHTPPCALCRGARPGDGRRRRCCEAARCGGGGKERDARKGGMACLYAARWAVGGVARRTAWHGASEEEEEEEGRMRMSRAAISSSRVQGRSRCGRERGRHGTMCVCVYVFVTGAISLPILPPCLFSVLQPSNYNKSKLTIPPRIHKASFFSLSPIISNLNSPFLRSPALPRPSPSKNRT